MGYWHRAGRGGTRSSREWAEEAEARAEVLPDPAGDAGLVPSTDGAGAYGLVERFGPADLQGPENHITSLVAPYVFPQLTSRPPVFWGPPDAPTSGQLPQEIGIFQYAFTLDNGIGITQDQPDFHIAYRQQTSASGSIWFGIGIDADNYWWVRFGERRLYVILTEDGVDTELLSETFLPFPYGRETFRSFRINFGRSVGPCIEYPYYGFFDSLPTGGKDYLERPGLANFVGFGGFSLGTQGDGNSRFDHVVAFAGEIGNLP